MVEAKADSEAAYLQATGLGLAIVLLLIFCAEQAHLEVLSGGRQCGAWFCWSTADTAPKATLQMKQGKRVVSEKVIYACPKHELDETSYFVGLWAARIGWIVAALLGFGVAVLIKAKRQHRPVKPMR